MGVKKRSALRNSTNLYEANYRRLMELLPDLVQIDEAELSDPQGRLHLSVLVSERFNYTTDLEIQLRGQGGQRWLPSHRFRVRLCHDARVAEVISFQGHHRLAPDYEYPNPQMFQPDEKRQSNLLLAELIDYCARRLEKTEWLARLSVAG